MTIHEKLDEAWLPFSTAFKNGGATAQRCEPDRCAITGTWLAPEQAVPFASLGPAIRSHILKQHPGLCDGDAIDSAEIIRIYEDYIDNLIADEERTIARVVENVASPHDGGSGLPGSVDLDPQEDRSLGEVAADRLAAWGSSWGFMLGFIALLLLWIGVNLAMGSSTAFDPYPFILLNLVLSCLAALQAPVIMMSQRRQEAKDRQRAQSDYEVNLRAEREILHLQKKVDHLLQNQWRRLSEMQGLRIEMLRLRRPG